MKTILMTEAHWANSQFSVIRHYGRLNIDGSTYIIVNKDGKDIFQCSAEAAKAGREMAIEPGESCDMIRLDFLKYYRAVGRDKFIEALKANNYASEATLKKIFEEMTEQQKS